MNKQDKIRHKKNLKQKIKIAEMYDKHLWRWGSDFNFWGCGGTGREGHYYSYISK